MAEQQALPAGPDLTQGVLPDDFTGETLLGHVADDFVDLRDAALDALEHLERMLGDDVPRPVDLPVGDDLIILMAKPGRVNEKRGRQRDRCHEIAVQ